MNSDRPIDVASADKLHRAAFAKAIAEELASIPAGPGQVVAIVGPWGAGKTSVLNLIRETLDGLQAPPVVTSINPWLFSGTEQFVELFIRDLARQVRDSKDARAASASQRLDEYADALDDLSWLPVTGKAPGVLRVLAWLLGRRDKLSGSLDKRRMAIGAALESSGVRLLVVVDDIDRLNEQEIRDIVRTVRLVGDFQNVTYLLAFDRQRVEKALVSPGDAASGRDYLEKIVQTMYPLPEIRYSDLSRLLFEEMDKAIEGIETGPFETYQWQNYAPLVMRPLFASVRDVYRFVNVLPAALRTIGDEIALEDVLVLEAVRVLDPDVWEALARAGPALGSTSSYGYAGGGPSKQDQDFKASVEAVIAAAPGREHVTRELLRRLFPASERFLANNHYGSEFLGKWRRERRVASPDVFAIYLHRTLESDAVAAAVMDAIFDALNDAERLARLLDALSPSQLEEALGRLEAWENDFPVPSAGSIAVLYQASERLRRGRRGVFDFGASQTSEM